MITLFFHSKSNKWPIAWSFRNALSRQRLTSRYMHKRIHQLLRLPFLLVLLCGSLISPLPAMSAEHALTEISDMRAWDLETHVSLNGPWQVIRGKIVRPSDFEQLYKGESTSFPDRWHDDAVNKFNQKWPSGYGSASYRLKLLLPTGNAQAAIKLQTPYSSHEMWVNGKKIAANGTVSETPQSFQAFYLERIIPLPQQTEVELVLIVSNFEHFAGGVLRPPILAPKHQLDQAAKAYDLSYLFVLGALSALLVFQLAYFIRSLSGGTEWSHFWYCILLVVLIVRLATLTTMPFKLFPSTPQFSTKTLEYLTLFSSAAVYLTFLASMFPKEFPKLVRRLVYVGSLPFVASVVFLPVALFTQLQDAFIFFALTVLLYSQGATVVAWRRRRDGAGAVLLFTALFLATAVNDSLLYLHSVNVRPSSFPDLMPFGFLLMSVGYAIALSAQSRAVYDHTKQLSDQLLKLNKTLDERVILRTEEAVAAKLAAEKSATEKTNFISAASHDLRQPVHALGLFNQTLQHSTQHDQALSAIADKQELLIGSLSEMLETMLEASRLEAKTLSVSLVEVCLGPLFEGVKDTLQLTASQNGVRFCVAPSSLTILADPKHLKRVITNLVVNAIKASPSGHVLLGARALGSKVAIDILDNGSGIGLEDQGRIFDRFVQLEQKKSSGPAGLGLGLSIVADLCDLMALHIDLKSTAGKGSHFRIVAEKVAPSRALEGTKAPLNATHIKRFVLLVVDDDKESLEAMVSMFRQWGHAARGAGSYLEAIESLEDLGQPDLLVTDYQLDPDTTGLDLYRTIIARYANVAAVIVTGATAPNDLRALEKSKLPIFHKPLNPANMKVFLSNLNTQSQ
ncbi:MAG: response regulator [Kordiimonadaceae bacterium]|nr:response regulator [Kordiimonadaceae bacterium]